MSKLSNLHYLRSENSDIFIIEANPHSSKEKPWTITPLSLVPFSDVEQAISGDQRDRYLVVKIEDDPPEYEGLDPFHMHGRDDFK